MYIYIYYIHVYGIYYIYIYNKLYICHIHEAWEIQF